MNFVLHSFSMKQTGLSGEAHSFSFVKNKIGCVIDKSKCRIYLNARYNSAPMVDE